MHGGDVYRNNIHLDFSVNLNPLGVPSEVQWVLTEAALHANKYPDILHEKLIIETAKAFDVLEEEIVYGNGASELIMAICHWLQPKSVMVVSPCFLGYERCLLGANPNCNIIYYRLNERDDYSLNDNILYAINEKKPKVLFLTNPNNPNGLLIDKELLNKIIAQCDDLGITVIVDECFLTLTGREGELSLAYNIGTHKSLIVIRAYTKTFSIPGVRLGYAICSKKNIADGIKAHLPEWNISIFAQMAGAECLKHLDYIEEAANLINRERSFLSNGLSQCGMEAFPSEANFILFKSPNLEIRDQLLKKGILIRDCSDFEGLTKGFYRVAVRQHEDNAALLSAMGDIMNE